MPLILNDPNTAVAPDFTREEYQEARTELSNELIDDALAARILTNLWSVANNKDKVAWAQQREEEILVADREHQQLEKEVVMRLADEQNVARREECKKNKSKYAPVRDIDVPSDPVIIPLQYTTRKMKAGEYCELHYFTNRGLEKASHSLLTTDAEVLVMLTSVNGVHTWVPVGAMKDTKTPVTKDKNLTWEQFNGSAPRMVSSM
ncbi:hypothetical protein SERLA73DRAFT_79880 [Serpula lacrymans var. lacrymans S7.3]|uniref:Uncharacterized protein n=2 Tax=Serpula lacrymans var. lacrymans TaxID=341189 RepID=F8QHX2_SERL3|nr:uncharacterized protein SERLADRAFT_441974 [Serpula lacrymans var. lacrymans S7.9]EGN92081.1 hypothetical protein SERLA73DRAFT_79880 [Serpula lacrymans var. lacrymans S7.3]EGO20630.1 hypothetical protein SERLADRAFT_441974 [Serpula lacrymans var. lacrymans S7.9]